MAQTVPYARTLTLEIERKFLVPRAPDWLADCRVEEIDQGYLAIESEDVEVRLRRLGDQSYLTIKHGRGQRRTEAEVGLGGEQFAALWPLTEGRRLRKLRHYISIDAGEAEIDVYQGPPEGLITAEVEFSSEQLSESFDPPEWMGPELTGEPGYANRKLATCGMPAPVRPRS